MWRQRQTAESCWSNVRLSRKLVETWFSYLFPLSFVTASFLRPSTVASAVYVLIAFVVLFLPALCGNKSQAFRWHRLHLAICLLCGSLFVAAATMLILCRQEMLHPDALSAAKLLFFGTASCNDTGNLLPEIVAFTTAFLGWILGCCAKRLEEAPAADVDNPLMSPKHLLFVALILYSSASLHFNLFALVYQIVTLLIVLLWARSPQWASGKEIRRKIAQFFRFALLTVCSAQVSSVAIFNLPGFPDPFSASVNRMLGLEISLPLCWQNIATFLLIQLLLWPAEQRQTKLLPTRTSQDLRTMEEALPRLKSPEEKGVAPREEKPRELENDEAQGLSESDATSTSRRSVSEKVSFLCGRALLPMLSMMALFMVWPSLMTLPLLLAGFLLHHIPVERIPSCLFFCALVYEVICSIVWFCYNIFCTMGDLPLSRVPYEFTWLERAGLQCYLRRGPGNPEFRRYFFVLGQGLAILAVAACARSRRWQERRPVGSPSRSQAGSWLASMLLRKVVAFSRPFTVSFVVLVILGQSSANVFGMLYLLWLLGLTISGACASYVKSGWDLLRANRFTWQSLLVLSNCIVLALSYCQVVESKDIEFIGLERSSQTILKVTWAHLTIGVLAGLQCLAFSQKVQIPAMFVNSNSALAWFLWIAGIFVEMGLMLNYVMIKPLTVDSFFILFLFLGIVAVEQFGAPACWRNMLLTATAFSCGLILVVRYALLMPKVQEWLAGASSPLPQDDFPMAWKGFAIDDTDFQVRLKLGYLAANMLLSTALRRLYRFGAAASLIGVRSQICASKNKVAMSIFLEAARWSTVVLICTCYFIMPLDNALSHMQLAVLILMLMSGRCWDYAGSFISLTSSVSLLVQYAYTFNLVKVDPRQAQYWGLEQEGYYAELALLLLGIVQRTVKRASLHFLSHTAIAAELNQQALVRRQCIRQETVAYGAKIGAAVLLLTAMMCNSAWSVIYVTAVLLYACSKDSRRSSSAQMSNSWLRLFVLLLALSLAISLAIKAWLPEDILERPSVEDIANLLCKAYADSPVASCKEDSCHTERYLCGQSWAYWLGFVEGLEARGDITFTFMAFFSVCVVRHICLVQMDLENRRKHCAEEPNGQESSKIPSEMEEPTRETSASPRQIDAEVRSEEAKKWSDMIPHVMLTGSSILLKVSLAITALVQPHANVFTLGYLFLLAWYVFSAEGVRGGKTNLASLSKVNKRIFACNLAVAWAVCAFQCPAMPCPFAAPLQCSEEECPSTFLVSPALCRELSEESIISLDGSWHPRTILLQCLGVQKNLEGLSFAWCNFWIFLVFVASLIQELTLERCQEIFEAHVSEQVHIRSLRERWYHEHLLHWRRYELRRVDMKHKVLMVKLQSLMAYIRELRAIWENKRGELTAQERAQRAREDRILNLSLQSGHSPQVVEPLLQELTAKAASACGPWQNLLTGGAGSSSSSEKDTPSTDTNTLEVVQSEALESINGCVLQHLQDIQLQRLRRISAQDLSERKMQLLQRCVDIGEAIWTTLQDGDAVLPQELEAASEDAGHQFRLTVSSRSHSSFRRQNTIDFVPAEKDRMRKVFDIIKAKVEELCKSALSGLVDDFLYTCDAVETLQSHRKHDGVLTLIYKAFWSQTMPLLLIFSVVRFATYTSVFNAVTLCAIVASLMTFPHPHPHFWRMLLYFNMTVVLLKVLYQLPIFPISVNCNGLEEDMEHGLYTGLPVPWESVLGLIKVAPQLPDKESMSKELYTAFVQLQHRYFFRSSLLHMLWPDLLVCTFLVFHWHTLRNSGRLTNPAGIWCRLAGDDMKMRKSGRALTVQRVISPASNPRNFTRALSDLSPCARAESPGRWLQALQNHLRSSFIAIGLRKPAMDLFLPRAMLMMCCFFIIIMFWEKLMEGGESFVHSISSNSFSGQQVIAVMVFLVLMVQVRAEYTWYTQRRGVQSHVEDKQGGKEAGGASVKEKEHTSRDTTTNLAVVVGQRILFFVELLGLHGIFIAQWAVSAKDTPRISNSVQLAFYISFMLYLALTSLQMRYDIHVTSGGLGLTHRMDLLTNLAFKAYLAMPFAEEMRVLTDWTITRTSMDFFMWMKLEDAQQSLYRTKRDFYYRRWYPPAAPRPKWEKVVQGGLLLLGLMLLIVAPIALFSTLNPSLQSNRLTSATLSGDLIVQSSEEGIRQMQLYKGSQVSIVQEPGHSDKSRDAAEVTFAVKSEENFDSQTGFQDRIAEALGQSDSVTAWFQFTYQLEFNGDTMTGVSAQEVHRTKLSQNTTLGIGRLVNESLNLGDSEKASVLIPAALQATIRVNSNLEVQFLGDWFDVQLSFQPIFRWRNSARRRNNKKREGGRWTLEDASCATKDAEAKTRKSGGGPSCPITQLVATEKSAPVPVGASASSSWSVMGIYLGVVYTIGRLLRNVFQDSSKRVIYEEIPDTSLLEDLCNGIYIARIQHLLRTEYKLYYQLMSILRSPELLLNVTGNFCNRNFDDEVDISAVDDDIPGAKAPEQWLTVVEAEQESEETYVVPESSDPAEDRVLDEINDDERFFGVADERSVEDTALSPTSELRRRNQGTHRGHSHIE